MAGFLYGLFFRIRPATLIKTMRFPEFKYDIQSGPVHLPEDLNPFPAQGNCRLAIQAYFHLVHGIWLKPEQVLCPALYRSTGQTISANIQDAIEGDIILAERIRNKKGETIDRSQNFYATEDEWIISLHSAIIKNIDTEKQKLTIWHATAFAGGTCEWSKEDFENYYRVVMIKRI